VGPEPAAAYQSEVGNSPNRRLDDNPSRHQAAAAWPLRADWPAVVAGQSDELDDPVTARSGPAVHPAQGAAARSDWLGNPDPDSDRVAERQLEVAAKFVEGNRWAEKRSAAGLQGRSDGRDNPAVVAAKRLAADRLERWDALDRREAAAKFPAAVLRVQWGARDSRVREVSDLRRLPGQSRSIRR
jgi:hypothetical protein